ncbi:Ribonuclease Z [Seminavis robusta]|uniref:Ribonuclease Z n=1 Tax=Seminavis robusta TaxID=568900 RepID=A0A9N8ETR8_9STRA|nr:Ribonuclease Z [Seminavis robusta]|eukprot:Sro1550_g281680.1 Ribonuclease Z (686) ;mRNA; f:5146-7343
MKLNIFGSRGSIARSHKDLIRYGGNTSCVEVETDSTRVVLDMGSGAYDLGQKLVKLGAGALKDQHVLLSHCHWDHIQGFPFFAPLFVPGSEWNIYAPGGFSSSLKDKLSSQMSHDFFPLTIEQLNAEINYHDLKEGQLDLGEDIRVTTQYINHTVLTLGYRLECKKTGASMAYITDHEMYNHALAHGYQRSPDGSKSPDDRHADFFAGVDVLIHDTQYVASEYAKTEGYGHSTVEYVVDMAMAVGVRKLALFHHDPQRTDDQVDEILAMARARVAKAGGTLEVIAAADFSTIEIAPRPERLQALVTCNKSSSWTEATKPNILPEKPTASSSSSALTTFVEGSMHQVVISHSQLDLFQDLESDGLAVNHIPKGRPFLQSFRHAKPALIVVRCQDATDDYVFKNCQRLRQCYGNWGKEVPYIVVVANQECLDHLRPKGERAGVTDWVVEPFSPAYIRTRIRMGIARNPCKWKPPIKPCNERARLNALQSLQILDSKNTEERFDRITKMCATVFGVPLVFVSLVDENRQWFKSAQWLCPMPPGPTPSETPREVSFCGHTILQKDLLVIPDATQDDRFADNPFVADGLKVRFYAGCPLALPNVHDGGDATYNIGTLCIIDMRPRDLDDGQQNLLRDFGEMIKNEIMTHTLSMASSSATSHKVRRASSIKPVEASAVATVPHSQHPARST